MSNPTGPLAGIRVVDCSTVLAGPYATMLLADLGADVVKVEPPEGDSTRGWGPPWVGDEAAGTRTAAYFLSVNRNKRSLRLDLKQPSGAEVLRRLLATGDVFVENLRPDSLDRLGFGDDALREINPRLIHLAISGYGPTGPLVGRPGYDFLLQAEAGLMSITGQPDAERGDPDEGRRRDRRRRDRARMRRSASSRRSQGGSASGSPAYGVGQRVDVSIFESTLAILVNQAQNAFVDGAPPGRLGNAHPNIVPYEMFDTVDGEIAIAVGSERQWPRFCLAIGLPALADDPRFATNGARVENRTELIATLRERLSEGTTGEWLAALDAADIPAGPINDIPAAFASEQAVAREMAVAVDHPVLGRTMQVGAPDRAVGDAGRDPDGPAAAGRACRRDPGRARLLDSGHREPPGRRRDLRLAQSSWRRNDSHDRPAIAAINATFARTGPTTSPGGNPSASARAGAPRPTGRYGAIDGNTLSTPITMNAATPMPAAASAERVSVLPRNVIAAKTISASHCRSAEAANPPTGSASNRISV